MDGTKRGDIKPGARVMIVLKKDQPTGKLTEGVVKDLLTKSPTHPHASKCGWRAARGAGQRDPRVGG